MKTPSVSPWGPYAKKYPGISRVIDESAGVRWDCSVFPGLYRGPLTVPCHLWDSGFNPLWAAPDQAAHAYEFEFPDWCRGARAEVAYRAAGPTAAEFCASFSNPSDRERRFSLHLVCTLSFPWAERRVPVAPPALLLLREGDTWLPGAGHVRVIRRAPYFRQELPYDAILAGERAAGGAVDGHALCWSEDMLADAEIEYAAPVAAKGGRAFVRLRNRGFEGESLLLRRGERRLTVTVEPSLEWSWVSLGEGFLPGETFSLSCAGKPALELNGFVFTGAATPPATRLSPWSPHPVESRAPSLCSRTFRLGGPNPRMWFGAGWRGARGRWRDILAADLESVLPPATHDHVSERLVGRGEGCFTAAFLPCVIVPSGGVTRVTGVFAHGSRPEVEAALRTGGKASCAGKLGRVRAKHAAAPAASPEECARARLQATLMTNVVFPVRRFGRWIRHRCPGKWWDSLYTWDSGMIGLGLLEIDPRLAMETLEQYLCAPEESAAFVHHGSLVPTQIWLAREIWNRTRDRAWLAKVLPGLRRYYRFYSGRGQHATLAGFSSGLLRPWDYFYNSGGWDDYPPQRHVWSDPKGVLPRSTAPVATTAFALLFARQLAALERIVERPGARADAPALDLEDDIRRFTAALGIARDPASGFHGYVLHDRRGRPLGVLRHASGQNFNLGLDGALPLAVGACESDDASKVLDALFDSARLWTPQGLCAVDKSAAYYSADGYWNGMVWLPYQWLFFKALLDRGEARLAVRLARAASAGFAKAAAETGRCYEHFIPPAGQGAGWHHFGGLSAPWMAMDAALRRPGALTVGLDLVVLEDEARSGAARRVSFSRSSFNAPSAVLLVSGRRPVAALDGERLRATDHHAGLWSLEIPSGVASGEIVVA